MTGNVLAEAMKASFDRWLSKDPIYKRSRRKITTDMYSMLYDAFLELDEYKPGTYNYWYVVNHMRFNHLKQEQKSLMNELAHHFLTKYARNELNNATNEKKRTPKVKQRRTN